MLSHNAYVIIIHCTHVREQKALQLDSAESQIPDL